mmetsp:Transcript_75270/g.151333  ORF Transcript_75270/g.151333 Transcript_75270/m.151333 type:complete len:352 (-) Transcript_75270:84-1139(-)
MAALVGYNEGVPHISGVDLGSADRDVKEEFSSPMTLSQSGYAAGYFRSRAYDFHLHILGANVTLDPSAGSAHHFDSYVKVVKAASYDASVAAAAAEVRVSEGAGGDADHQAFDNGSGDVKRTKVARSTTQPIWREDLVLSGLEFDDELRLEVRTTNPNKGSAKGDPGSSKANSKANPGVGGHPDQNLVCWATFTPGEAMCAVAASSAGSSTSSSSSSGGGGVAASSSLLSVDRARVKFKLAGDKGSATVTAVVVLDPDMAIALRGLRNVLPSVARAGGERGKGAGAIKATTNTTITTATSTSSGAKYVSVNRNNACLLLSATSLAHVDGGGGYSGDRQASLSSLSRHLHSG